MRLRDLIFGALAVALLVGYIALGQRLTPLLVPAAVPTTQPKPSGPVSAPTIRGSIAFVLRGDVFVLRDGRYEQRTFEGRAQQPALSADGRSLYFSRVEEIDGQRVVDGQVVPAHLGFSAIVRKPAGGGAGDDVLLSGLTRAPAGSAFHTVRWYLSPAPAPDERRVVAIEGDPDGSADLVLYDIATKRLAVLSNGGAWADPAWSPDGKTIVVTSYAGEAAQLLLKPLDGRPSAPLRGLPPGDAYRASFSLDGRWLVYTLRHDEGRKNDVHAYELSSGRDVALTSDGQSWNGVFSPDGTQIAFLRSQQFTIDLWVLDLGSALSGGSVTKPPVRITNGEGIDGASRPAWSG